MSRADTSSERWTRDQVFNAAWAYDLAFGWDVEPELDVVLGLAHLDERVAAGSRVLLPACGTGRYAEALAERGFRADASDINPEMLSLARRERGHALVSYSLADMTRPFAGAQGDCAAAFTFCNSFRYILDDVAARGHLEAVRGRLL